MSTSFSFTSDGASGGFSDFLIWDESLRYNSVLGDSFFNLDFPPIFDNYSEDGHILPVTPRNDGCHGGWLLPSPEHVPLLSTPDAAPAPPGHGPNPTSRPTIGELQAFLAVQKHESSKVNVPTWVGLNPYAPRNTGKATSSWVSHSESVGRNVRSDCDEVVTSPFMLVPPLLSPRPHKRFKRAGRKRKRRELRTIPFEGGGNDANIDPQEELAIDTSNNYKTVNVMELNKGKSKSVGLINWLFN